MEGLEVYSDSAWESYFSIAKVGGLRSSSNSGVIFKWVGSEAFKNSANITQPLFPPLSDSKDAELNNNGFCF